MRRSVARWGIAVGVIGVVAVFAAGANALLDAGDEETTDGPVIAIGEDWDAYPTAMVTGRITRRDNCLLLGESVVFWPHLTTWDEGLQAVTFGGDFKASDHVSLSETFTGGGGFYSPENVSDLANLDAASVLRCMQETGAQGAVFAYPG